MTAKLAKTTAGNLIVDAKLTYCPNAKYGIVAGSKSALVAAIRHDVAIWRRQAEIHHPWQAEQMQGTAELQQIITMIENWN